MITDRPVVASNVPVDARWNLNVLGDLRKEEDKVFHLSRCCDHVRCTFHRRPSELVFEYTGCLARRSWASASSSRHAIDGRDDQPPPPSPHIDRPPGRSLCLSWMVRKGQREEGGDTRPSSCPDPTSPPPPPPTAARPRPTPPPTRRPAPRSTTPAHRGRAGGPAAPGTSPCRPAPRRRPPAGTPPRRGRS